MVRKYYKKGLIKFNVDEIKDMNDTAFSIKLFTHHPEIIEFHNKEIWLPIQSKEFFLRTKPKVVKNKKK